MNPITRRSGAQRPRPKASSARPAPATRQKYEWYLSLGREAQFAGDTVEMERYYQFADHYFRVMRAAAGPDAADGRGRAYGYEPTTSRLKDAHSDRRPREWRDDRDRGLAARAEAGRHPEKIDSAHDGCVTYVLCTPDLDHSGGRAWGHRRQSDHLDPIGAGDQLN
jgi:hypothetical protein